MAERTAIINGKTISYNDCNSNQVYAVIKQAFPDSDATDWTQEMVWPYIATGADAEHCLRTLRRAEENLNSPKPKRNRRQRCPYEEAIHGNYDFVCTCCEKCEKECADKI